MLKIDTTDSNEIPFLNRGLEKNPLGNDRKTPNADTKQRNVRENIEQVFGVWLFVLSIDKL